MQVLDLEKQSEVNTLIMLLFIDSLLLLGYLVSPESGLNILAGTLALAFTTLIITLLFNGKKTLTVCKYGVHTLSIYNRASYFAAQQIRFIRPYSICGIRGVIIMGDKFICVAPFYALTAKHQQRLKRYENGLFEWLKTLQTRNDYC
ncbi:hypothetical protein [Pseudoalteromonas sp.]|uniref:hypothetical protein n=1 Tax=Pseudoalteromonas sp. TaxID=53249 RepID=UPI0030029849